MDVYLHFLFTTARRASANHDFHSEISPERSVWNHSGGNGLGRRNYKIIFAPSSLSLPLPRGGRTRGAGVKNRGGHPYFFNTAGRIDSINHSITGFRATSRIDRGMSEKLFFYPSPVGTGWVRGGPGVGRAFFYFLECFCLRPTRGGKGEVIKKHRRTSQKEEVKLEIKTLA